MDFNDLFDLDKVLDEFEASEAQLIENENGENILKPKFDSNELISEAIGKISDPVEKISEPIAKLSDSIEKLSDSVEKVSDSNRKISDQFSNILRNEKETENFDPMAKTSENISQDFETNENLTDVNLIGDFNDEQNEEIQTLNEISADAVLSLIEDEVVNDQTVSLEPEHTQSVEPENQEEIIKINQKMEENSLESCSKIVESDENLPETKFVGFSNLDEKFHEEEFDENEFEKYLSDVNMTNVVKQLTSEFPTDVDVIPKFTVEPENQSLSEELAECQFVFESNFVRRLDAETVLPQDTESVEKMEGTDQDLEETKVTDVQVDVGDSQDVENVPEIAQNAENLDENGFDSDAESLDEPLSGESPPVTVCSPAHQTPTVPSPEHQKSIVPSPEHQKPTVGVRNLFTVASADEVGSTYKPTESELQLGKNAPVWIPDNDTMVCMLCESKFTVIKRRHHCRACGRVLCGDCCRLKAKLPYVENKEVRICSSCSDRLKKIDTYEKNLELNQASAGPSAPVPPDPSSTPPIVVPSTQVASADVGDVAQSPGPPDPVSVPTPAATRVALMAPVGVLKRGSVKKEPKQVIFSDGIKPGGDLSEPPSTSVTTPSQPPESSLVTYKYPVPTMSTMSPRQLELHCFLPTNGSLYPPIVSEGEMKTIDVETLTKSLTDADAKPVVFAIKKNLLARVKLLDLDCCVRSKVWCFASDGLRNVAQDELLIVVAAESGDQASTPPVDVLRYFNAIYEDILKGKPMSDMSYGVASQLGIQNSSSGFMGSKDNAGFLHTRPTYQCLKTLCLPEDPFLIGVLIQKVEVPWAKVLPLRLALRLGAESKYYPWSLVSEPYRKPVVAEIGHTIMSVLNDFRNFTYNIAHLPGSWITLEEEKTVVNVPAEQYNQVMKILSSSNEHVLSWATSFCYKADSHLVCVQQTDTGSYLSQTINKEDRTRKVTGGCFVIFNASLKAGGPMVRSSIVEDGVMIQVRPETMESIRDKLNKQQNFKIQNEPSASPSNSQPCSVEIRWGPMVQAKLKIASPIDGRSLSDAPRYRLYGKVVEASSSHGLIRLVALFILPNENGSVPSEPDDLHSIVKRVSLAVASALLPHFSQLIDANLKTVGVRFTLGADMVDYAVGSNGKPLPENLVPLMDDCLIPVLHGKAGDNRHSLKVELTLRLLNL